MRTVICCLKSGGIYDAEWVAKLQRGVARHLGKHEFVCLSDVSVPCRRIPLIQNWPGWWSKIELFHPSIIETPTVYLDLDTVITGDLSGLFDLPHNFAMLRNMSNPEMVGSGVMYFSGEKVPTGIYTKFARQADAYIAHYKRNAHHSYLGDQAFIWDTLGDENIARIQDDFQGIHSYKRTCLKGLPKDARIVVFPGSPKPTDLTEVPWMQEHWK